MILRKRRKNSRIQTLHCKKAYFNRLRKLVDGILQELILRGKVVQESWLFLEARTLRIHKYAIPMKRKDRKHSKRPDS